MEWLRLPKEDSDVTVSLDQTLVVKPAPDPNRNPWIQVQGNPLRRNVQLNYLNSVMTKEKPPLPENVDFYSHSVIKIV